jgi:hypothetical protein
VELLGERLSHGVKEDALEIMRLRVRRLGRGMVAGLRAAGLLEMNALRGAQEAVVRKAVGRRSVADAIRARVAGDQRPTELPPPLARGSDPGATIGLRYTLELQRDRFEGYYSSRGHRPRLDSAGAAPV